MNWHKLAIYDIFELLGTGPQGLEPAAANEKLLHYGPNKLQEAKRKTILGILLAQFKDVMILILLAAAILSGLIGDFTDTVAIFVIIIINAVLGFVQEYRAEKAMQALRKMAVARARVLRGGKSVWLPAEELVPGDLVVLEAGNAVPADMRITECMNLKIEEAALTGESEASEKTEDSIPVESLPLGDRKNMAYKGTFAAYGRGTGVVVATGMQTELGRIAAMLQEEEALTPLQQRMASFAKRLSLLVLFICVLFFAAGWLRGENTVTMLLTSISLAVAAIPEALPAVITIALALAARRMIRLNSLIKKLPAVETLGSVTYICTDKTGTLTKNKMHVEEVYAGGKLYADEDLYALSINESTALLMQGFALNNDTVLEGNAMKGDSTEIALLEIARNNNTVVDGWPRISEIAFDSERKLMTTFHHHNGRVISFTKGAPEVLLKLCRDTDFLELYSQVDRMGKKGYRVIGFGYRYWDVMPDNPASTIHEQGLLFLGLAGILDPPRDEVPGAVAQCKSAGIVPVMITGDHPLTAETIARRIGIIESDRDLLITGQQLSELDEESFAATVEQVKVYARVSPEQKLQIVKMLQSKGHYVAMTGDGVNDAPSLKMANIGIAMGIAGTDVSKEAAHMILLDDNFSTIIRAVKEGRRVYDNILKFIKYLMTTNSSELLVLLLGPLMGLPIALLPIHILWINLVSDGLPALALSYEKEEHNIMKRPPRPPHESVFAGGRGLHMLWVGALMAGIVLAAQAWAVKKGLPWQTIIFNLLSLSQMGHLLAIRTGRSFIKSGLFTNIRLIASVLLVLALQAAITYTPALQPFFHTESLTIAEFLAVGAASSIVFFAVETEKALFRKKD